MSTTVGTDLGRALDAGVERLLALQEPDGFWVEYDHRTLVRIALPNGDPDPARPTLEGRRVPGTTTLLRAARDPSGFAIVSALGPNGFLARIPFGQQVMQLEGLDADPSGNVFVAAHVFSDGPAPQFGVVDEKVTVVALSPAGPEVGRFNLPPPEGPEQQFRPIAVSKSGALYHLHVGATGATIRRAR